MAILQEFSGQGRVVGGHLSGGTVASGGATPFSKNSDLSISHTSNPFRRHRINSETVTEWEELDTRRAIPELWVAAATARSREDSARPSERA